MKADPRVADALPDKLLHPSYWLVSGLGREGDGAMAEAAVAIAPGLIPRDRVSNDARQIIGCADLYARKHRRRVVFFSDLTRMFTDTGTSWSMLGVEWENALRELQGGPFPALYLVISERAHLVICDPHSSAADTATTSAAQVEVGRDLVRQAVARQLAQDWPPYMQSAARDGSIQVT